MWNPFRSVIKKKMETVSSPIGDVFRQKLNPDFKKYENATRRMAERRQKEAVNAKNQLRYGKV